MIQNGAVQLGAYNELAWLQATCPDERYRNGDKAVVNAGYAHLLGDGRTWEFIDTLAAAFAEIGEFSEAVQWQTKAIGLAPETKRGRLQMRLELYKQGKPYRGER